MEMGSNACKTKWQAFRENGLFYLGSQVAVDGGCERDVVRQMCEGYRAWWVLKSVLNNRGLRINVKKYPYEAVIVPTALYGAEAWV